MHLCIYDYLSLALALSPPSIPLSLSLSPYRNVLNRSCTAPPVMSGPLTW